MSLSETGRRSLFTLPRKGNMKICQNSCLLINIPLEFFFKEPRVLDVWATFAKNSKSLIKPGDFTQALVFTCLWLPDRGERWGRGGAPKILIIINYSMGSVVYEQSKQTHDTALGSRDIPWVTGARFPVVPPSVESIGAQKRVQREGAITRSWCYLAAVQSLVLFNYYSQYGALANPQEASWGHVAFIAYEVMDIIPQSGSFKSQCTICICALLLFQWLEAVARMTEISASADLQ